MTNELQKLIDAKAKTERTTGLGRFMHARMQMVFCNNGTWVGDADIVAKLKTIPDLMDIMGPDSRVEVPIAGTINGRFISRRIDRLYVNNKAKKVIVLDYKTDIDKSLFYTKYIAQLTEYRKLLEQIYKGFDIECKILWLNDFTLENIA